MADKSFALQHPWDIKSTEHAIVAESDRGPSPLQEPERRLRVRDRFERSWIRRLGAARTGYCLPLSTVGASQPGGQGMNGA